jgi:hypothetical protein
LSLAISGRQLGGVEQFPFLEAVVTFPAVQAGSHGELLVRIADELCAELGLEGIDEVVGARSSLGEEGVMAGILSTTDEELVSRLRTSLARISAALGARPGDPRGQAVLAALDGAEMVVRGELLVGNADQLPRLMPSFVFLVALPIVEQDRALELSRRTAQLIANVEGRPRRDGR